MRPECVHDTVVLEFPEADPAIVTPSDAPPSTYNIGSEEKIASTITSVDQAVIADDGLAEHEELD